MAQFKLTNIWEIEGLTGGGEELGFSMAFINSIPNKLKNSIKKNYNFDVYQTLSGESSVADKNKYIKKVLNIFAGLSDFRALFDGYDSGDAEIIAELIKDDTGALEKFRIKIYDIFEKILSDFNNAEKAINGDSPEGFTLVDTEYPFSFWVADGYDWGSYAKDVLGEIIESADPENYSNYYAYQGTFFYEYSYKPGFWHDDDDEATVNFQTIDEMKSWISENYEDGGVRKENTAPTSEGFPGYDLVQTTLCGVFYVKPSKIGGDLSISEAEAAITTLGYYTEEEKNNYKQDVLLCYKDFIFQYIGEENFYIQAENQEMSFSSIAEAEAYIDANLVDTENPENPKDMYYMSSKGTEKIDKDTFEYNFSFVDNRGIVGSSKSGPKYRAYFRFTNGVLTAILSKAGKKNITREFTEKFPGIEKSVRYWCSVPDANDNGVPQVNSSLGIMGTPTAEAASIKSDPFSYVGPDGKTVSVVEVGGVIKPGQRCFDADYGGGSSATFIFNDNWSLDESYDNRGEGITDEYTVEAIVDRYNPKAIVDSRLQVLDWRGTTRGGATIPQNIKDYATDHGCLPEVKKVAKWMNQVAGKGCPGGVAVGKGYSTLILDITYQDGALSVNSDSGTIMFKGVFCEDYKQFKAQFDKYYVVVKSLRK
jgi:hypothetical protein